MAILKSAMLSELVSEGITGIAAECLLREGAGGRHQSRVNDAKCAAVGEIRLIYSQPTVDELLGGGVEDFVAAQAAGLCLLDQTATINTPEGIPVAVYYCPSERAIAAQSNDEIV